jgi:hypothetical protein
MWLSFGVSAALVFVVYAVLTLCSVCRKPYDSIEARLFFSTAFSLVVAALAELSNLLAVPWPWCQSDCGFDAWNLIVSLNGATAAVVALVGLHLSSEYYCSRRRNSGVGDAATVASTVVPEGDATTNHDSNKDLDLQSSFHSSSPLTDTKDDDDERPGFCRSSSEIKRKEEVAEDVLSVEESCELPSDDEEMALGSSP